MRLTLVYLPSSQRCNADQVLPALERAGVAAEAIRLRNAPERGEALDESPGGDAVQTMDMTPLGGLYLAYYFASVYSRGEVIGAVAGGIDPTPELLLQMLDRFGGGADVVIASRYHRTSQLRYPWKRLVVSKGYNLLASLLLSLGTTDSRSGLKLYRREWLTQALRVSAPHRTAFDVHLLATIRRLGGVLDEVPVSAVYQESPYGLSLRDVRQGLTDTLRILYATRVKRGGRPVR